MKISYNASAVDKLIRFFRSDEGSEEMKAQAFDRFQALKEQT
jgi:hypothetical protein